MATESKGIPWCEECEQGFGLHSSGTNKLKQHMALKHQKEHVSGWKTIQYEGRGVRVWREMRDIKREKIMMVPRETQKKGEKKKNIQETGKRTEGKRNGKDKESRSTGEGNITTKHQGKEKKGSQSTGSQDHGEGKNPPNSIIETTSTNNEYQTAQATTGYITLPITPTNSPTTSRLTTENDTLEKTSWNNPLDANILPLQPGDFTYEFDLNTPAINPLHGNINWLDQANETLPISTHNNTRNTGDMEDNDQNFQVGSDNTTRSEPPVATPQITDIGESKTVTRELIQWLGKQHGTFLDVNVLLQQFMQGRGSTSKRFNAFTVGKRLEIFIRTIQIIVWEFSLTAPPASIHSFVDVQVLQPNELNAINKAQLNLSTDLCTKINKNRPPHPKGKSRPEKDIFPFQMSHVHTLMKIMQEEDPDDRYNFASLSYLLLLVVDDPSLDSIPGIIYICEEVIQLVAAAYGAIAQTFLRNGRLCNQQMLEKHESGIDRVRCLEWLQIAARFAE